MKGAQPIPISPQLAAGPQASGGDGAREDRRRVNAMGRPSYTIFKILRSLKEGIEPKQCDSASDLSCFCGDTFLRYG